MKCFEAALRLQPDFPEAHNNLGGLWQERQEFARAAAHFRAARATPARPSGGPRGPGQRAL